MGGTTIGNGTIGDSAILVAFAPTPWVNSTRESIPAEDAPGDVASKPKAPVNAKPEGTPPMVSNFRAVTSEAFIKLLPITYWLRFEAA